MADIKNKPDTPSSDHEAMLPYWMMVGTILEGSAAMRAAREKYLPKFPNESAGDYKYRNENAKFTNIYRDIVENLAAKPFAKELTLKDTASSQFKDLAEDIDGQGNSLHVFAGHVFFQGINNAIDWIFVDKPPVPTGASLATEKAMGARPYWVHIPAKRMLAVYSAMIAGKEEIVHARIDEPEVVRDGYKEKTVKRVREFNRDALGNGSYGPARFTLWEEVTNERSEKEWIVKEEGPISIGIIALVPFIVGKRKEGSWQFVPPMQDAAYLQIEHYQQETNLKSIKDQACFPMLSGNGVSPPLDQAGNVMPVPVGPKTVLFAPIGPDGSVGSWTFIEPSAQTLTFLSTDIKDTETGLRELGRQPLTANSGNLTVITTAFAAQKGNTAIQAWALNLKDALEQALKFTAMWLGDTTTKPEVNVYIDFSIELESEQAPDFLLKLRDGKEISRKALIAEAKRRDFLSPEYDEEKDMEEILKEVPADTTEQDIVDALPQNIENTPPAGNA